MDGSGIEKVGSLFGWDLASQTMELRSVVFGGITGNCHAYFDLRNIKMFHIFGIRVFGTKMGSLLKK